MKRFIFIVKKLFTLIKVQKPSPKDVKHFWGLLLDIFFMKLDLLKFDESKLYIALSLKRKINYLCAIKANKTSDKHSNKCGTLIAKSPQKSLYLFKPLNPS